MRYVAGLLLITLLITGCGPKPPLPITQEPTPPIPAPPEPIQAPPPPPARPTPERVETRTLHRDQVRDRLLKVLNEEPDDPWESLKATLTAWLPYANRPDEVRWAEADLNGDGHQEMVVALPVVDGLAHIEGHGAALFVIYQIDGGFAIDRTSPMDLKAETEMMHP